MSSKLLTRIALIALGLLLLKDLWVLARAAVLIKDWSIFTDTNLYEEQLISIAVLVPMALLLLWPTAVICFVAATLAIGGVLVLVEFGFDPTADYDWNTLAMTAGFGIVSVSHFAAMIVRRREMQERGAEDARIFQ